MVVANWRLMATSRFSSPLEYSYSTWLRRPIIPIGLSLPQNKTHIQEPSLLERIKSATAPVRCGRYSAVITSARARDEIAKTIGKADFRGAGFVPAARSPSGTTAIRGDVRIREVNGSALRA